MTACRATSGQMPWNMDGLLHRHSRAVRLAGFSAPSMLLLLSKFVALARLLSSATGSLHVLNLSKVGSCQRSSLTVLLAVTMEGGRAACIHLCITAFW
jgi:hypothetical protein